MAAELQEPTRGGAGGPESFTFEQDVASAAWVIVHNLGYSPAVTVVDTLERVFLGEVTYDSDDQVTVRFATAVTGKAYLS